LERESAYCPACGSALQADDDARTILTTTPTPSSPPQTPPYLSQAPIGAAWLHSHSSADGGFAPGSIVGGRFRIVGLLGRGGMGEVYRADDLLLAQPVALKFLPRDLATDGERLARFYGEVRIARQVSHPNVCRVYDIGEIEGQPYLSMEHVDGDDLASLLRRIGRLPEDKGLEVARQMCAGLAAAHERGVLHRDLKPANILIDAQGKVRITDFGLAVLADRTGVVEKRAGTPAYMAPEQLARNEVSVQSDIYSLGLVLYEMFTGKRAVSGNTMLEVERQQRDAMPQNPSTILADIDPAIERAILRCLDKDPRARPDSALAVAVSLPGGDPLAAALAAGELPSPEIVAAAGGVGALRRRTAWAALGVCIAGLAVLVVTAGSCYLLQRIAPPKPVPVLQERVGHVLSMLGYTDPPADEAWGFIHNQDYLRWVRDTDRTPERWHALADPRVPVIQYWHRHSTRPLLPWNPDTGGRVTLADPPRRESGMRSLVFDSQGNLMWFEAVPPQIDSAAALPGAVASPVAAIDWQPLFDAAGLDPTRFQSVPSIWVPGVDSDTRVAWTGSLASMPDVPLRVEAGATRDRVVTFAVVGPWTRPDRMAPPPPPRRERIGQAVNVILVFALLVGSCIVARRHVLRGHGDRRGAARLALAILGLGMASWLLAANHVASATGEWDTFVVNLGMALFLAGLVWVLYLALEPYVRRVSPDSLISWNRLLAGRGRDPRIGRDVLLGITAGTLAMLLGVAQRGLASAFGDPMQPETVTLGTLRGARATLSLLADLHVTAIISPMAILFLIVSLRFLVRKQWIAVGLVWLLFTVLGGGSTGPMWLRLVFSALGLGIVLAVLLRFGLLAGIACNFVVVALSNFFMPGAPSGAWYAPMQWVGVAYILALVAYAFHISRGGQPLAGRRVRAGA
jgi:serine/threonine-protein kinase